MSEYSKVTPEIVEQIKACLLYTSFGWNYLLLHAQWLPLHGLPVYMSHGVGHIRQSRYWESFCFWYWCCLKHLLR